MRALVIGDVHGCLEELQHLLKLAAPAAEDRLIFIGDLIDRGPFSADTVKYVTELSGRFSVQLVLGNHEEKFLRYLHHVEKGSDAIQQMRGIEEFPALAGDLGKNEIDFLKASWYAYRIPDQDWLCVHGGIPGTTRLDLRNNYRCGLHDPKEFPGLDLLTKTRYLTPEGRFVSLGAEQPHYPFWAETYDGRFGKVFFGHQPFLTENPPSFPYAMALDTGCVYGGWLSACVIHSDGTTEILRVSASRKYSEKLL